MQYENPKEISSEEAEIALTSLDPLKISDAMLSLTFHGTDWQHAQKVCLNHLEDSNPAISGLAATCLGHIARIHGKLDRAEVIEALKQQLGNPEVAGRVSDAIDDIEMFLSK